MKSLRIFFLTAFLLTFTSTLSFAEGRPASLRLAVGTGVWWGSFDQSYQGVSSSLKLDPAFGFETRVGLGVHLFFVDWAPSSLSSASLSFDSNRPSAASSFTLLAANAGVSFLRLHQALPLEVYVGLEDSGIGFNNGVQIKYSGSVLKFGADFIPFGSGFWRFGATAQYRIGYMKSDDVGGFPSGASVRYHVYYLGLVLRGITK